MDSKFLSKSGLIYHGNKIKTSLLANESEVCVRFCWPIKSSYFPAQPIKCYFSNTISKKEIGGARTRTFLSLCDCLVLPTLPVIRVVLLHTEQIVQRHFSSTVCGMSTLKNYLEESLAQFFDGGVIVTVGIGLVGVDTEPWLAWGVASAAFFGRLLAVEDLKLFGLLYIKYYILLKMNNFNKSYF